MIGASEGIRTLDIHVGNVTLYQTELRSHPRGPGIITGITPKRKSCFAWQHVGLTGRRTSWGLEMNLAWGRGSHAVRVFCFATRKITALGQRRMKSLKAG